MTNWSQLAATSHYQTAVAVDQALRRGALADAQEGIQELIDALARSERRALRSQLIRLMAYIIKWRSQPDQRSRGWRATIRNARAEIADIQEDTPSLNRAVIESLWDKCFPLAKEQAEGEMNQTSSVTKLTWEDVFDAEYEVA
ncbi:MAG: DUF29 domain-containing protein [Gemmataceae bacterium]